MTVADLIGRLSGVEDRSMVGDLARERAVTAITYDSRRVTQGAIFVAMQGVHLDGVRFVSEAMNRGAALVVSASGVSRVPGIPWLTVKDARLTLAELATAFHGHPSRELRVVGITGTNGKTTTTYLLASVLEAAGFQCGRIGSVHHRTGRRDEVAERTTPEAPDVQSLLREMVDQGCSACVMEVSSHALAMRRVDGTRFAAAVFSNLSRDHLDYHTDMTQYFEAKRRLFDMLPENAPAVVNMDDPRGRELVASVKRPLTYAIDQEADVMPERIESSLSGHHLDLQTPSGRLRVRALLPGRLNIYNVLAAVGTAVALDVPLPAIQRGIAQLEGVPGRFEVISTPNDDVCVVVDFAHTDDALRLLLTAVRALCEREMTVVFGCGGDRDRTKRPLMGAVAARLADLVVLTSDNPRSEDPEEIVADISRGFGSAGRGGAPAPVCIIDRRAAITYAIDAAEPGDVVVIAGKGHETDQVIGDERRPFDDRVVAASALSLRRTRATPA
jgi:UDP-N-acetylmuramoyl-L-alanyl-D-glutamate--2,6-diaminopimelate ligase